jgi:hypothetical protein
VAVNVSAVEKLTRVVDTGAFFAADCTGNWDIPYSTPPPMSLGYIRYECGRFQNINAQQLSNIHILRYAKRVKVSSVYFYRGRNLDPSLHAYKQALARRVENQVIVHIYEI